MTLGKNGSMLLFGEANADDDDDTGAEPPIVSLMFLLTISGMISNVSLLLVMLSSSSLRTPSNVLLMNVCLTSLLLCVSMCISLDAMLAHHGGDVAALASRTCMADRYIVVPCFIQYWLTFASVAFYRMKNLDSHSVMLRHKTKVVVFAVTMSWSVSYIVVGISDLVGVFSWSHAYTRSPDCVVRVHYLRNESAGSFQNFVDNRTSSFPDVADVVLFLFICLAMICSSVIILLSYCSICREMKRFLAIGGIDTVKAVKSGPGTTQATTSSTQLSNGACSPTKEYRSGGKNGVYDIGDIENVQIGKSLSYGSISHASCETFQETGTVNVSEENLQCIAMGSILEQRTFTSKTRRMSRRMSLYSIDHVMSCHDCRMGEIVDQTRAISDESLECLTLDDDGGGIYGRRGNGVTGYRSAGPRKARRMSKRSSTMTLHEADTSAGVAPPNLNKARAKEENKNADVREKVTASDKSNKSSFAENVLTGLEKGGKLNQLFAATEERWTDTQLDEPSAKRVENGVPHTNGALPEAETLSCPPEENPSQVRRQPTPQRKRGTKNPNASSFGTRLRISTYRNENYIAMKNGVVMVIIYLFLSSPLFVVLIYNICGTMATGEKLMFWRVAKLVFCLNAPVYPLWYLVFDKGVRKCIREMFFKLFNILRH